MNGNDRLQKPRVPKRFYFLSLLIYLPILFCLTAIRASWLGWLVLAISFAALVWMRHSALWQGWRAPTIFLLAYLVAFGGMYVNRPRRDVSFSGQLATGTMWLFQQLPVDESVKSGDVFSAVSVWKAPDGFTHEVLQLENFTMERLACEGGRADVAVLQLHGGAFVAGMNDLYREVALRYSKLTGGATVFTPDYRLAPTFPYPAQQEDAWAAWHYLTETLGYAADHIVVAGDSAGGNLTLSLPLRLRDAGEALPCALIAMSPWADLSNSGESHLANATTDPTFGVSPESWDGVTPVGVPTTYVDTIDPTDPDVSPSYGDYAGFPPMLLQAAQSEVLLSDSMMVSKNANSHGVDCTLTVYPGLFHVFQGSFDLLPESKAAWEEVAAFLTRVLPAAAE